MDKKSKPFFSIQLFRFDFYSLQNVSSTAKLLLIAKATVMYWITFDKRQTIEMPLRNMNERLEMFEPVLSQTMKK